jgi:hypothetical protein
MSRNPLGETSQLTEELIDKFRVRPSLLSRLRRDRRARRLDHGHHAYNQQLAWRVQDIIVGCGLVQVDYSIAGGRVFHIPQVISVDPGPQYGSISALSLDQCPTTSPHTPGRSRIISAFRKFVCYRSGST